MSVRTNWQLYVAMDYLDNNMHHVHDAKTIQCEKYLHVPTPNTHFVQIIFNPTYIHILQ